MNIRTEKLWLIEQVSTIADEDLLIALRGFLQFSLKPEKPSVVLNFIEELNDTQRRQYELALGNLHKDDGIPAEGSVPEPGQARWRDPIP